MPNAGPSPQRQGRLLAVVIDEHAMATVERALRDRVEQAEGRHDRAGRQHLDHEVAAGHVVDLLGEVLRVLVKDVLGRPGALPAHVDWRLRLDHARRRHRPRRRYGRAAQELADAVFSRRNPSLHSP